ncbi:MAG: hypothetical protein AAF806_28990 [Bacteroidota bacterium]
MSLSINPLLELAIPIADKIAAENDLMTEEVVPFFESQVCKMIVRLVPNYDFILPELNEAECEEEGLKFVSKIWKEEEDYYVLTKPNGLPYLQEELEDFILPF